MPRLPAATTLCALWIAGCAATKANPENSHPPSGVAPKAHTYLGCGSLERPPAGHDADLGRCTLSPADFGGRTAGATGPAAAVQEASLAQPTAAPSIALAPQKPVALAALPFGGLMAETVALADEALKLQQPQRALELLRNASAPAAHLLAARALRLLGKLDEAAAELEGATRDEALAAHVALERGLIAWARGDAAATHTVLLPLLDQDRSVAAHAAPVLLAALGAAAPALLLEKATVIEAVLSAEDVDARSLWLEAQAAALDRLDRAEEARGMRLRRYLEEPVSPQTPDRPPEGTDPSPAQLMARAEVLLDAHRSDRVIEALAKLDAQKLEASLACRHDFALGLASRKLRHYAGAEEHLAAVVGCADTELARRAMYLQAKVVSIRSGLRAVPIVEAFAARFGGHSMVDDVLFWAGDLYQRRRLFDDAVRFFRRIEELPEKGDHCGEARWRQAWMDFTRDRLEPARAGLERILLDDGCAPERFDRSRARYWLGRVLQLTGETAQAVAAYRGVFDEEPLGFYAQMALKRLMLLDAATAAAVVARLEPAAAQARSVELCPGFLAGEPAFLRGLELLLRGLRTAAAAELLSIHIPAQDVLGTSHAAALGVEAKPPASVSAGAPGRDACSPQAPLLLLSLLLDRAGAFRDAHWRLRTDFGDILASFPGPGDFEIWRAAYPLAFRRQIGPAEEESALPSLLLQALCREESALDPQVVSWAGAYGLTQLLLSSGRAAGRLLKPPVDVRQAEDLLDPAVSARLGGALLGSLVRKFGGNVALALAAYNAGDDVALAWWKRHQGQPFDVFAEEMTIKETRGYVARVLKTFGVYRWLYAGEPPALPIEDTIPPYRR